MTTQQLRKLLRERHQADPGNGPAWAYLEEIRDEASFDGKRTLDAIGLGLWKSRGYELHGYELKISRGDLLKELKNPAKADPFFHRCDRFWLVCASGICKVEEVPAAWGLLLANSAGDRLRVAKMAPRNQLAIRQVDRSFLVCLLRSAGAGLKVAPERAAIEAARESGREKGFEHGIRSAGDWKRIADGKEQELVNLKSWQKDFEQTFGVELATWRQSSEDRRKEVFDALRLILGQADAIQRARSGVDRAARDLDQAAAHLNGQAQWLRENVGAKA